MDGKDWAIIGLLLVAFAGPLGVHLYHKRKNVWSGGNASSTNPGGHGPLSDTVPGDNAVDDSRRIGAGIAAVGGRALTEGAKMGHRGAKNYGSRAHRHDHMQIGGAVGTQH